MMVAEDMRRCVFLCLALLFACGEMLFAEDVLSQKECGSGCYDVVWPKPKDVVLEVVPGDESLRRYFVGNAGDAASRAVSEALDGNVALNEVGNVEIVAGVRGDASVAEWEALIPDVDDGYFLKVEPNRVIIGGNDDRGVFYGAKSFGQLVGGGAVRLNGAHYEGTIVDAPAMAVRGVVEGFYGNPWSFEDRRSQFEFYGDNKLNIYIYGPKDDPWHHSKWFEPYPKERADNLRELVDAAKVNRVKFVWAMHPSNSIVSAEDRDLALKKFVKMYELGVRAFAVFFDDIEAESVDAQIAYVNFLTEEFVEKHDDVDPLIVCPTQYACARANGDYLPKMGAGLKPDVRIMFTGQDVVNMIDRDVCEWFVGRTGRKPFIWLNYPVNDYGDHHLLMGKVEGNDATLADCVSGFVSNPMQYAEASKVGVQSIADFCWSPGTYDADKSWHNAVASALPGHDKAFMFFCENNVDMGPSGLKYRIYGESPRFKTLLDKYPGGLADEGAVDAFRGYFEEMRDAAEELLAVGDQSLLLSEIKEFIEVFRLQGERGIAVVNLYEAVRNGGQSDIAGSLKLYDELTSAAEGVVSRGFEGSIQPVKPRTATLYVEPFIRQQAEEASR